MYKSDFVFSLQNLAALYYMKEKVNSFKHLKKLLGERNAISFYHICHNPLLIIARKLKTNKFQSLKNPSSLLSLKNHLDFRPHSGPEKLKKSRQKTREIQIIIIVKLHFEHIFPVQKFIIGCF